MQKNIRPFHPVALAAATVASLLVAAPAAHAQAAAAPAAAAPAAAASAPAATADAPQVVEVTAQGRKQEVQSVPIAIQLIGPQEIAKTASANIANLADFVPGLQIDASEPTQPSFALRGLGNSDFGIGTDSPVGIYVNGLYAGKTGGALLNFNDVKRVEVLKGPQGTLFGRNSAGGAISIVTNDPDGQRTLSGLVRAGNQGSFHAEGVVNQPLTDDLSLRLSAVEDQQDGWARNQDDVSMYPMDRSWGTRLGVRWSPTDATSAVLSWEHEDLNQRPRPIWALVDNSPTFDSSASNLVDPRKQTLRNDVHDGKEARILDGLRLHVETELSKDLVLSSNTGFHHFNTTNIQDNDGTDRIDSYLATGNFEKSRSWEQEFRLNGKTKTADWLVGLSWYDEHADQTSRIYTYSDSLDTLAIGQQLAMGVPPDMATAPLAALTTLGQAIGLPVNLMGQGWQEEIQNTGDFRSMAVFADAIWHLGADTNLTTGVRFTQDHKRFSWYNPRRNAPGLDAQFAAFTPDLFANLVAGGAITQDQSDALQGAIATFSNNIEFTNPAWASAPQYTTATWNNTSPRLVLDHHFDTDTMAYASVSRGYQAGGFNAVSVDANGGRFDPETITSLEAGAKGRLRNVGLTWDVALFHYLFKNLQAVTLDTTLPIPAYVVTVSDVQATGLDFGLSWQVAHPVRLFTQGEWIDQTYKRQSNLAGGAHDLTGQPYGTPSLSFTLGADVQWALGSGTADFTLQGSWRGAQRCNDDSATQGTCLTTPTFRVGEARQRYDARLGWDSATRKFGGALIVNNLTNERYVDSLSTLSSAVGVPYYATLTAPRRVMVELSAKF